MCDFLSVSTESANVCLSLCECSASMSTLLMCVSLSPLMSLVSLHMRVRVSFCANFSVSAACVQVLLGVSVSIFTAPMRASLSRCQCLYSHCACVRVSCLSLPNTLSLAPSPTLSLSHALSLLNRSLLSLARSLLPRSVSLSLRRSLPHALSLARV